MTCNELILLLDVRRGFRKEVHCGTLDNDLRSLKTAGLIGKNPDQTSGFDYFVTHEGDVVCQSVLKLATDMQPPMQPPKPHLWKEG